MLELDAGLALVDAVDREADGGDLARLDDALGGRDRRVGVTHFSQVVVISSSSMPTAWAIIGTVAPHAMIRMSGMLQQRP